MDAIGPISFAILLVVNIVCAHAAQRLARERGRSPKVWLWLSAFFGGPDARNLSFTAFEKRGPCLKASKVRSAKLA